MKKVDRKCPSNISPSLFLDPLLLLAQHLPLEKEENIPQVMVLYFLQNFKVLMIKNFNICYSHIGYISHLVKVIYQRLMMS